MTKPSRWIVIPVQVGAIGGCFRRNAFATTNRRCSFLVEGRCRREITRNNLQGDQKMEHFNGLGMGMDKHLALIPG